MKPRTKKIDLYILAPLDTSACEFKGLFCAYATSSEISCARPFIFDCPAFDIRQNETFRTFSLEEERMAHIGLGGGYPTITLS